MKRLTINLPSTPYDILIERGLLAQVGEQCKAVLPKARTLAVVTDDNVAPLYSTQVIDSLTQAGFSATLFTVPAGESSKSIAMLEYLYESFMTLGLTRTDAVVALGGGVIGDLAGFAASTVLRGVDFIQIPTTLLSQVDSSVGGKVAIDLKAGKNLAGAFWHPKLVLMDPDVLETLPDQTFADGMAEVVKYGCIFDKDFYQFLKNHPTRPQLTEHIESILYTCCDLKRIVVVEDERDTGMRMLLNFGHTLGHAYELAGNYADYTHGQGVAAGMVDMVKLGIHLGITPPEVLADLTNLLADLSLPVSIPCAQDTYASAIGLDKKGSGGAITLILLNAMGEGILYPMEKQELLDYLATNPQS